MTVHYLYIGHTKTANSNTTL